ncbi:MAG: VOC family protein, partial [Aeromicrobium sp.]
FYTSLAGWEQIYADDEWITITTDDGWRIGLQLAPDHVAPQWPDPAHPQQLHLDIQVDDIEAAEPKALALGATKLPGEGPDWRVYADPAGKPFCLIWENDEA